VFLCSVIVTHTAMIAVAADKIPPVDIGPPPPPDVRRDTDAVKDPATAISIAQNVCPDSTGRNAVSQWWAQFHGRTWDVWTSRDGRCGGFFVDIDAATGKPLRACRCSN
jgi:hypothetical protein